MINGWTDGTERIRIPQHSAYECIKKLVEDHDAKMVDTDKIYLSTNNPYFDYKKDYRKVSDYDISDMWPESMIRSDALEEMFEKERKMTDIKAIIRTVRNEVDDMAERYGLSMSTEYDTCTDKMMITCGKITRARAVSDKIFIQNLRQKTAGQVLEIIERWLVDVFDVNPDRNPVLVPQIKNVIHNDPATIVFWADNSKTVVKCQEGDIYDPEKGLAMAISKKALGNQGRYCNEFKKWLPEEDTAEIAYIIKVDMEDLAHIDPCSGNIMIKSSNIEQVKK